MTNHEHEWYIYESLAGVVGACRDPLCGEMLTHEEVEAILNEHGAFKRVRDAADVYIKSYASRGSPQWHRLRDALADTQESG